MSRLSRRCSLTIVAVLAALAAPTAAQAATYTVKAGDGACGGGDLACGTLADAAAAVAAGDSVSVTPGTYASATFSVGGVTIAGAGPGVAVNGTLTFTGSSGGVAKLQGLAVAQAGGTGPAIGVTGAAGLAISDVTAVSLNGHGITFSAGTANKIERSIVVTGSGTTDAVRVISSDTAPAKALTVDSSLVVGGAAGIAAVTSNSVIGTAVGDITLTLRHLTAAGSTNGVVLDATQALGLLTGVGSIAAAVSDSIVFNASANNYVGVAGVGANTAAFAFTRTLQSGDRNALFAAPATGNYRLRPGSPAIDAGGFTAGESTTDIDGDPRPGPTTDLGGDEFVNAPPTAAIAVKTKIPRATQPVQFDASGSKDREAAYGGGIVSYRWTFSDGKSETTAGPTTSHAYPAEGDASASVVVVDRQGAASAPASAAFKLADGVPPAIAIATPRAKQVIALTKTTTRTVTTGGVKHKVTTRKRTRLRFSGIAKDKSGVAFVLLTVQKLDTTAKASQAATQKCRWLDPVKGFKLKSCDRPKLIRAKLAKNGTWSYTVSKKIKLSAGAYRVTAVGADGTGAFGNSAPAKVRSVRFTLAKEKVKKTTG